MDMTYRLLGTTGTEVSPIALGGFHLGKPDDPGIAVEMVRTAIDGGITFMDNCWDYNGGESERRMGAALKDGYRERAFLMTKLDSRSRDGVLRQFEESLTRLGTDHVDLLQLHEVIRPGDPDEAVRSGGALETYVELQQQGAVRFIGFTGHKDPSIHRAMIERAVEEGFHLDTVQMPLNPFDASYHSFRNNVLPLAEEHGIAVLGMKPLAAGVVIGEAGLDAPRLLRWALAHPVATVVTGCESVEQVRQAIDAAMSEPMPAEEADRIVERVRQRASDGALEHYKTTAEHDGTSNNPQWRD